MLTKDDFNKLKSLGVARVIVLALLLLSWQPCVQHKQELATLNPPHFATGCSNVMQRVYI